jgi:DNA repair photolyase
MPSYRYSLAPTSQFYYCGLPLRLDAYSRCLFQCTYCFANARGGYRGNKLVGVANPDQLDRRLGRLSKTEDPKSVIDEFLIHRQPIHFGGISDPFINLEKETRVSLKLMRILANYDYPTIISTKAALVAADEYLDVLKKGNFVVQLSISSLDSRLSKQADRGTPSPSERLEVLKKLVAEDIPTACRIQPLIPTFEEHGFEVIDASASIGVRHVAVEHLKLPIESTWWGTRSLSQTLGLDLTRWFRSSGATRVGREWLLPRTSRIERILMMRDHAHSRGLSFGAADNDLLLLSDGECCCSGIDLVANFGNFFRCNYPEAFRRAGASGLIRFNSLDSVWAPTSSIRMYVNSNSRHSGSFSIRDFLRANWNGSPNGSSPGSFFGIVDTGERDEENLKIYYRSPGLA